jgi:hypothetical protein
MSHLPTATAANPFLMMVSPEVVLAAVEKSERLANLNRHLCRPLDTRAAPAPRPGDEAAGEGPEFDTDR